jgi:predicted oxidoreductase (fatty acid repression mutant protein)
VSTLALLLHPALPNTFTVWLAFEAAGLGANLQHYNPLIDKDVARQWDIPKNWKLRGQLVFGTPTAVPTAKDKKPVEERYRIIGS